MNVIMNVITLKVIAGIFLKVLVLSANMETPNSEL